MTNGWNISFSFYSIIDTLQQNIDGAKNLADCSRQMDLPKTRCLLHPKFWLF